MKTLAMILAVGGLILAVNGTAQAVKTITVNPGAGTPVQDAINSADPGDTVHLNAGEYREWVIVDKAIILEGAGADSTTLRGWARYENETEYNAHKYEYNPAIKVLSSNVEVRHLRIEEGRTWGIEVYQSGTTFTGISIHDNKFDWHRQSAIRLYDVSGAQVYNNESFRSTRQTWYDPAGTVPGSLVDSTSGGDVVEVWSASGAATEVHHNTSHDANLPIYLQSATGVNVHHNTLDVRAPTTSASYNFGFVDTTGIYVSNTDNATFDSNTVTGDGYLAARLFSTSDNSTFVNNTFNSPVRDEGGPGTTWASSNTWNDGHQSMATTGGQWWKKGDAVIMTQDVASGNSPVATNLVVTAIDPSQDPGAGHGWYAGGETGDLIGSEVISVTSDFAAHTFTALIKFYYQTSELDAEDVPQVVWWDETDSEWKLANADCGGHTYSGGWRGNFLPDIADDLVLGDYGYYDDASYKFGWAYVDHYTDFGMVPEPGTMVLLGLGGIGLLIRRRRRMA